MNYDVVVIGSGAAGCMAALEAKKRHDRVALVEKLSQFGAKLKATGGGRCNLTNTLAPEQYLERFGKVAFFMRPAIEALNATDLRCFFDAIGVKTATKDGFRVFPQTHNALTVVSALQTALTEAKVDIFLQMEISHLDYSNEVFVVESLTKRFTASSVVIATGALGFPKLGAHGDGFSFAQHLGHTVTPLHPAMTPLKVKEQWVASCTADTMPNVRMKIALKEARNIEAQGDLIFTKEGIRGPVVLDFSREITPLLKKYAEVPLVLRMTPFNQQQLYDYFKEHATHSILQTLRTFLPESVARALIASVGAEAALTFKKQPGNVRDALIRVVVETPLHVTDDYGFERAMITRGGVHRNEIDANTMCSKVTPGLYFAGEVIDVDGPCGGFNLQWSFASGYLAGNYC